MNDLNINEIFTKRDRHSDYLIGNINVGNELIDYQTFVTIFNGQPLDSCEMVTIGKLNLYIERYGRATRVHVRLCQGDMHLMNFYFRGVRC